MKNAKEFKKEIVHKINKKIELLESFQEYRMMSDYEKTKGLKEALKIIEETKLFKRIEKSKMN